MRKAGHWLYYFKDEKISPAIDVVFEKILPYRSFVIPGMERCREKDCVLERKPNSPVVMRAGENTWWKTYGTVWFVCKTHEVEPGVQHYCKIAINHDGELFDIRVETPQNAKLDGIAVSIIKESPAWIPAVQYNFKVNAYRRQPITFVTTD